MNNSNNEADGSIKPGDTFTVAVAGKGGTGKTTVSGLVIRELVRRELGSVLAIDADPNSNLNELLGFEINGTIGQLEARFNRADDVPAGMSKKRWIEYKLQQLIIEGRGKDLLVMGRGEGPDCYCSVNNILRNYLSNLRENYDFVVLDNEAGLEHLSRRTTSGIDVLLTVCDPNPVALKAAERIDELVEELGIAITRNYLVLNEVPETLPKKTRDMVSGLGIEVLGRIPKDENVRQLSWEARPLAELEDDSPAAEAVSRMVEEFVPESAKTLNQR